MGYPQNGIVLTQNMKSPSMAQAASTLTYGPVDRGSSFVPNDVSMCGLCTSSCQNISHITTLVAHSGPKKNLQNKNMKRKLNRA